MAITRNVNDAKKNIVICLLIIVAKKHVSNVKLKNYDLNFLDNLEFSTAFVKSDLIE